MEPAHPLHHEQTPPLGLFPDQPGCFCLLTCMVHLGTLFGLASRILGDVPHHGPIKCVAPGALKFGDQRFYFPHRDPVSERLNKPTI